MYTFNINQHGITVRDAFGEPTMIRSSSARYSEAKDAVMSADWETFYRLSETSEMDEAVESIRPTSIVDMIRIINNAVLNDMAEDDSDEFEEDDSFVSIADKVADIKGLLSDELISPEDLGLAEPSTLSHEHDLSQWSGSPIFYPTREMAREQSDRWGMFWEYHDFGIASPAGYRYATVPRLGLAPTAPDGYDWVCLPREE